MLRRWLVAASLLGLGLAAAPGTATAHTESDVVAVPAGSEAVVTLKPTHGCGDSPTVKLSTRVPVPEAFGGEVGDWLMVATGDGPDRTVIEWSGSTLPADEAGAFPVHFTVPDTVGELVTFPFIQECADGSELAWISGDPAAEFPAPRVLVLAAGSAPASSVDDVPTDAPGRNLLVEIVDVDNVATTVASTTTTSELLDDEAPPALPDEDQADDGDGSSVAPILGGVVLVLAVGGGVAVQRRRSRSAS